MLHFSEEFNCQIKWIYLESGHRKGIPDGIGAAVKHVIQTLIAYNPSLPIYTVKDFMIVGWVALVHNKQSTIHNPMMYDSCINYANMLTLYRDKS